MKKASAQPFEAVLFFFLNRASTHKKTKPLKEVRRPLGAADTKAWIQNISLKYFFCEPPASFNTPLWCFWPQTNSKTPEIWAQAAPELHENKGRQTHQQLQTFTLTIKKRKHIQQNWKCFSVFCKFTGSRILSQTLLDKVTTNSFNFNVEKTYKANHSDFDFPILLEEQVCLFDSWEETSKGEPLFKYRGTFCKAADLVFDRKTIT